MMRRMKSIMHVSERTIKRVLQQLGFIALAFDDFDFYVEITENSRLELLFLNY